MQRIDRLYIKYVPMGNTVKIMEYLGVQCFDCVFLSKPVLYSGKGSGIYNSGYQVGLELAGGLENHSKEN